MIKIFAHLRSEWYKYLIEIVVIIFSILLAFALNNWGENLKDHKKRVHLVQNLTAELNAFKEQLINSEQFNRRAEERIDSLVNNFVNVEELSSEELRLFFLSTLGHSDLEANLRSVDNAVSQEGSELLASPELKEKLYEFQRMLNYLSINNRYLVDYWNNLITPFLIAEGYMIDFQNIAFDRFVPEDRHRQLLNHETYRNIAAGKAVLQRDFAISHNYFIYKVDEIIKFLDEYNL